MQTGKFKNKYRIASTRLQNWDYGWAGAYFITVCTKNRKNYFGDIKNGIMQLSNIGVIVRNEWEKTFAIRPDMNLQMGEFVVMPNHFHAIVIIGENQYNTIRRDAMHCVSTTGTNKKNKFGVQSKNLASVIRGFKIGVTTTARKINPDFAWQPRFYDHIIRDEKSFDNIINYIINNPDKWANDKYNVANELGDNRG